MVRFKIYHLLLFVTLCGIGAFAYLEVNRAHPTVKNHGGHIDERYGMDVDGGFEVRFGDKFTLFFYRMKADVIGFPESIPFVIVVESDENSMPTLRATIGASYGLVAGHIMIDEEDSFITITHGLSGFRSDGSPGDFEESNVMVEVNEDIVVYHDLSEGRLFWIDLKEPKTTPVTPTIVVQYDIDFFSMDVIDQYLSSSSDRYFAEEVNIWLRRVIKAKTNGELNEIMGMGSPNN